jgi:erythromycin esterase-like protein
MKPKAQDQQRPSTAKSRNGNNQTDSAVNAVAAESAASAATAASPPAKKQKTGTTTAAGRKIARKTAHSLIERRRRSKMNEEFATLKDMIPACKGQDMHKLAILQVRSHCVAWT